MNPYNYKKANSPKYPIIHKGKVLELTEEQIVSLLKSRLKSDFAVQKLFARFEIDLSRLDDLHIRIMDLKGRYAETDEKMMSLDIALFEGGNFFEDNYFVVVHELVHWLSRVKECEAYFNDPEEVLGFVAAIASEVQRGQELDVIWNKIYPKVEFHFHQEVDAREFFEGAIEKARDLLSS